jgi:hypothetical protein
VLAAQLPTLDNGGLAEDGRSVTWTLKQSVTWHDGAPFTADDVVFNWEYSRNPATAAVTSGTYKDIQVEKVDQHTVRVLFAAPQPFWADAFVGPNGQIIPKHLFEQYAGEKSREAPTNLRPVGTGPYKFRDFKSGDMITGEINTAYHQPNRPYFDAIELKGGDIIPLIGMGIATFAMVWCFIKMWQYRHGWSPLNNLLANLRTLLRRRDARTDALVDRLTLPPAEFERKLADGA